MTELKECTHIFICLNQKDSGKCCGIGNAQDIFDYFKQALINAQDKLDGRRKFKVVKTSCLGRCSIGPNIFISPDNVWYNYTNTQDVDEIINTHLIDNKIVGRLVHKS